MTETNVKTQSNALQYYHRKKKEDPEFIEKKRIRDVEYYHATRKNNEEYLKEQRCRNSQLYHKKKEDPEYAEQLRNKWREATRARRLRLKELKNNTTV